MYRISQLKNKGNNNCNQIPFLTPFWVDRSGWQQMQIKNKSNLIVYKEHMYNAWFRKKL